VTDTSKNIMDISQLQLSPGLSRTGSSDGTSTGAKHSKIANAAGQFEALLIGEMLKSVREASDEGWMGGGSDSSAESAFGIAENQLAQTISKNGGFGLAKTIQRALEPTSSNTAAPTRGQ
jgi:Rod binding domain-containing protein